MLLRISALMCATVFFCGCRTPSTTVVNHIQEIGVVTDVLPLAVQPDLGKWRLLKTGMTEEEVTGLLGKPYRKEHRPPPDTNSNVINLYGWDYGEITFNSFTTKGSYLFSVVFHEGRVHEVRDPWEGRFSADGLPTQPEMLLPEPGQRLDYYPRFIDFRWHPASGVYPMEYEVVIQSLSVDEDEATHFEDYIRKTVESNREAWHAQGQSAKEMEESAKSFAQHLRQEQGVMETFCSRTHDIYLPYTWVGANTGRWRVRAMNAQGAGKWTPWRYFVFAR